MRSRPARRSLRRRHKRATAPPKSLIGSSMSEKNRVIRSSTQAAHRLRKARELARSRNITISRCREGRWQSQENAREERAPDQSPRLDGNANGRRHSEAGSTILDRLTVSRSGEPVEALRL